MITKLTRNHFLHSVTQIHCADECGKDIEDVLAECTKKHLEDSFSVPKSVRDLNSKCLWVYLPLSHLLLSHFVFSLFINSSDFHFHDTSFREFLKEKEIDNWNFLTCSFNSIFSNLILSPYISFFSFPSLIFHFLKPNLQSRSFKEAGLCLKNFAFRCMDDESRIKTGLILSGISLVGSSFCASQKEKEGILRLHSIFIYLHSFYILFCILFHSISSSFLVHFFLHDISLSVVQVEHFVPF